MRESERIAIALEQIAKNTHPVVVEDPHDALLQTMLVGNSIFLTRLSYIIDTNNDSLWKFQQMRDLREDVQKDITRIENEIAERNKKK